VCTGSCPGNKSRFRNKRNICRVRASARHARRAATPCRHDLVGGLPTPGATAELHSGCPAGTRVGMGMPTYISARDTAPAVSRMTSALRAVARATARVTRGRGVRRCLSGPPGFDDRIARVPTSHLASAVGCRPTGPVGGPRYPSRRWPCCPVARSAGHMRDTAGAVSRDRTPGAPRAPGSAWGCRPTVDDGPACRPTGTIGAKCSSAQQRRPDVHHLFLNYS
jgi:hypothetical protein